MDQNEQILRKCFPESQPELKGTPCDSPADITIAEEINEHMKKVQHKARIMFVHSHTFARKTFLPDRY